MKSNYKYSCTKCNNSFEPKFIELEMFYLCPNCGKSEKNKPLEGVLSIVHNYNSLKKIFTKNKILNTDQGKIWLFPELYPVDFQKINPNFLNRLSLPNNQVLEYKTDEGKLFFLDETRNPTYSYKDRASILVALKAMELGITEIAAASTGNAGSSLAGICARLGLKAHIFVPQNIPEAKRIQIQSYGANLYVVNGDYDEAFDLCLEISEQNKWYNRNTAFNPLTIEGKKSAAFDIYIQTKGNIPTIIFVPVGDGVIISGLHKGFVELKKLGLINELPKLIAVQAEGSSAVADYIVSNKFEYKPANSIADSISAGAPRNLFMAVNAVKESNGSAVKVSDTDILESQKELAHKFGLLVEPSCAASYAGYQKIRSSFVYDEKIMLLMTGSGLKDFQSLKTWNTDLQIKSYSEWMNYLS